MDEILKLEKAEYEHKGEVSPECKNVVCGAAVEAFEAIYPLTSKKLAIAAFVKKQTKNSRPKVRARAKKVLKSLDIDG